MVLALTCAAGVSKIRCLEIRYLTKHSVGFTCYFGKNEGKPRCPLKFSPFPENKSLCVCHHTDLHLRKTKESGLERDRSSC